MILKCDASQLEWRSYLDLSRDPVGIQEIIELQDVHTNNQKRFGLPTRLVSKTFLFRWIYRGSAYAYSVDPNFSVVSSHVPFWQEVIDTANSKYHVLHSFQNEVIRRAMRKEVIIIPSGREFFFEPKLGKNGDKYYDEKQITNYINQGYGNDLMAVCRVTLRNRLIKKYDMSKVRPFNTVHDDIEVDVDNNPDLLYNICIEMENAFSDIPKNFNKWYKYDFALPLAGEVSFGHNLLEMTKFSREKGIEQFKEIL